MDLFLFRKTLFINSQSGCISIRENFTQDNLPGRGERGDVILPFIITLMAASSLFFGLFLLNKLYEHKTKDHLNDFQNRWHHLEKRYQD